MATGNDILNYAGNANLGFGSSSLPAGSNAEIVDTSPAIKFWQQYAQNKLGVAQDALADLKKRQLQAQADVAKALDQNQYKIWDKDREGFKKLWNDFSQNAIDVAKRGAWGDVNDPDYEKVLKQQAALDQYSQFSTQQLEHWKTSNQWYQEHQDKVLPTAQTALDQYAGVGDPIKRAQMDINFDPKIGFDLTKYYETVLKRLESDNPTLTAGQADRYGYVPYTHQGQLNTDGAIKIAQETWQSDPDAQEFGTYLYNQNPSAYQNPQDAFTQHFVEATVPKSLQGEIKGINYAPGSGTAATQPEFAYETDIPLTASIGTEGLKVIKKGDGTFEVTDQSGKIQSLPTIDKSGNRTTASSFGTQQEAEKALHQSGGKITVQPVGGFLLSNVANYPSNININAPQIGFDVLDNKQLSKDDIGTDVWNVDVAGVFDWYVNKTTGKLADKNQVNDKNRDQYKLERLARVVRPTGQTVEIPYSENIQIPLENALRKAKIPEDKLPSNIPLGGFTSKNQIQSTSNNKPTELKGTVDPSQLVKGNEYIVNGKTYIWNGTKLQPK